MIVEVYTGDQYFDEGPCYARVEFDIPLLARILQLNKAVKKADAISITDSETSPEFLDCAEETWCFYGKEHPAEACTIVVGKTGVKWRAYLKGDSIQFYTDEIGIEEIAEIYNVLSTPKTLLPTLLGLKSEEAKGILEKRLKNG